MSIEVLKVPSFPRWGDSFLEILESPLLRDLFGLIVCTRSETQVIIYSGRFLDHPYQTDSQSVADY